jgi:hypothetical protein
VPQADPTHTNARPRSIFHHLEASKRIAVNLFLLFSIILTCLSVLALEFQNFEDMLDRTARRGSGSSARHSSNVNVLERLNPSYCHCACAYISEPWSETGVLSLGSFGAGCTLAGAVSVNRTIPRSHCNESAHSSDSRVYLYRLPPIWAVPPAAMGSIPPTFEGSQNLVNENLTAILYKICRE